MIIVSVSIDASNGNSNNNSNERNSVSSMDNSNSNNSIGNNSMSSNKSEDRYLLPLADGGIVSYSDNCSKTCGGCPTCGYGEEYTTEINILFGEDNGSQDMMLSIDVVDDYSMDQGSVIRFFVKNMESIKKMNRDKFIEEFCKYVRDTVNGDGWGHSAAVRCRVFDKGNRKWVNV